MSLMPFATVRELRTLLDNNDITQEDLVEFYAHRFAMHDEDLGSALEIFDPKSVIPSPDAVSYKGPLQGIPGLVKDVIAQKNRKLTCASRILENFVATYDATAVKRIKKSGGIILGRANCDEFAMGTTNESSAYKKCRNPWDHERIPGGSSGGSIAAVAAGLVPWALGTDTGGSVRYPAAVCGVVGLKPTYGRVSRYGLVAYASSFDQIGVTTRSVYDTAMVFSVIAGQDDHDQSSVAVGPHDYTAHLDGTMPTDVRIGIVDNALYANGVDNEIVTSIEQAIKQFEKLGAKISHVTLPVLDYALAAYLVISRAEAASNLSKFDGVRYGYRDKGAATLLDMYTQSRSKGFGTEVRRRILVGNYVLSAGHAAAFYENAKKVQHLIRQGFMNLFAHVDVLLMPTTPSTACKIGEFTSPLTMDLQDYFTVAMNLAGIPALALPCGFSKAGLPIGLQLVGPHLSEERLLSAGYAYEQATEWHTMHPKHYR